MRQRPRRRRAYILVVTLVSGILTLFLILHAGLQNEHFQVARAGTHHDRNLVATLSLQQSALDRLMYAPDWVKGYDHSWYGEGGVNATLTFDRGTAVHSTNNHAAEQPTASWDGKPVPAGFVNLSARSLSPDDSPTNPYDDALSIATTRQMMVNVYRQYFLEDFNADGQPGMPRYTWTCEPKNEWRITDEYAFLGVSPGETTTCLATAGESWWKDYDLEAVVAYYGYGGFGLVVRADETQAYAVSITPQHEFDHLMGAAVQPCIMHARGQEWELLPEAGPNAEALMVFEGSAANNPFITPLPRSYVPRRKRAGVVPTRDLPLAMWRVTVSIEDHDLRDREHRVLFVTVTRLDPKRSPQGWVTGFVDGPTWRSPEIAQLPVGEGPERGHIGLFCQTKTAIGFTHVRVNKRNRAMYRIPATWYDR